MSQDQVRYGIKFKQQKESLDDWDAVKQLVGDRHVMVMPIDRYSCNEIYNDAATKIFIYTSQNNTSNLLFVRNKGGIVSVIVLSPNFGFYSNRDLQMPFQLDKNAKTINAPLILYSIDRRAEYLQEIQDDILQTKKNCLICYSQNSRDHIGQTPELKKNRLEAIQLVNKTIDKQKFQEHNHYFYIYTDFNQQIRDQAIKDFIEFLGLRSVQNQDFDYQRKYLNDFVLNFKILKDLDEIKQVLTLNRPIIYYTEWTGAKIDIDQIHKSFYAFKVVFCVQRGYPKQKKVSTTQVFQASAMSIQAGTEGDVSQQEVRIASTEPPTGPIRLSCFYNPGPDGELREQYLYPALPARETDLGSELRNLLVVKLINCSRAVQFSRGFQGLQQEIRNLQGNQ